MSIHNTFSIDLDLYKLILEKLFNDSIRLTIIHNDKDLCFNSDHREILYAIKDCFPHPEELIYSECILGKALYTRLENVPTIPPFNNLKKYYLFHYKQRLELIDKFLNSYPQIFDDHNVLLKSKDNLYKTTCSYNAFYICLPRYILKYVFSFLLELCTSKSFSLRNKYNEIMKRTKTIIVPPAL
tara:strand:- start:87 stop:638 length:552 start_codon:yes stop_codon:yes gene_type:complete